ncbi:hypothetical protein J4526_08710 [Desulfurococcaceae archaeon MEX13E-LK6-19]|nr:hypothetical protein J4526_08710 [Desulfurococcaceae archaeon MEX13E-LK6-19]
MSTRALFKKLFYTLPSMDLVRRVISVLKDKGVNVSIAGYTMKGKPIYTVEIGEGETRLLVIAGIHGNEPAPVNAALLSLLILSEKRSPFNPYFSVRDYLRKVKVTIIPTANPEGLEEYDNCAALDNKPLWSNTCSNARTNSLGYDINRDWMFLTQAETRILHKIINEQDPHLIIDLHEFYGGENTPPQWPSRTLGFMITLTDAPYMWVNSLVNKASYIAMESIATTLKSLMGAGWPIKYRHFTGGDESEKPVALPSILGAHVALEGYPKVLVETWGVGLHNYLFEERVIAHFYTVMTSIDVLYNNEDLFINAKTDHLREEKEVFSMHGRKYVVKGSEIEEVKEVLELHKINYEAGSDGIIIKLPQERSRMALILLDSECEYNRKLKEMKKGPYTLDRFYDVSIEVV